MRWEQDRERVNLKTKIYIKSIQRIKAKQNKQTLPSAQHQPALHDWDRQIDVCQHRFDVRRHIYKIILSFWFWLYSVKWRSQRFQPNQQARRGQISKREKQRRRNTPSGPSAVCVYKESFSFTSRLSQCSRSRRADGSAFFVDRERRRGVHAVHNTEAIGRRAIARALAKQLFNLLRHFVQSLAFCLHCDHLCCHLFVLLVCCADRFEPFKKSK